MQKLYAIEQKIYSRTQAYGHRQGPIFKKLYECFHLYTLLYYLHAKVYQIIHTAQMLHPKMLIKPTYRQFISIKIVALGYFIYICSA